MRHIITLLFCLSLAADSAAQPSFCGEPYSTFYSANIFLGNDLAPTLDGTALPFGSQIIAAFQDGDDWKCAGSIVWEGFSSVMVVNGGDINNNLPGYAPNQAYRFFIQLPEGCLVDSVQATFDVSGIYTNPGFFLDGGLSKIGSFHAFHRDWLALLPTPGFCGGNTAGIEVLNTSLGAPFTYAWSNGDTTSSISNLPDGQYLVTVTDAFGCFLSETATVSNVEALALTLESQTTGSTCSATCTASGGTPPFSFAWSNGQNGGTVTNLPGGDFSVTTTDANGCTATATGNCMVSDVYGIEGLKEFYISPNPTSAATVVTIRLEKISELMLVVRNATGQALKTDWLRGDSFEVSIDFGAYAEGLYFVEVWKEEK